MKFILAVVCVLIVVIGLLFAVHQTDTDTAQISDQRAVAVSRTPAKRGPIRKDAVQPASSERGGPVASEPGGEAQRAVPADLDDDEQPGNQWMWDWFDRELPPPGNGEEQREQVLPQRGRWSAAEGHVDHHHSVRRGPRTGERPEPGPRHVVYHYGAMPAEFPRWFTDIDGNHDGQVDRFEWHQAHLPEPLFQQLDLNDDGLITPEEMHRVLTHSPNVDLQLVPHFDPPPPVDDDLAESRLPAK